jgi:predicted cupin superfamily sugar epimerase
MHPRAAQLITALGLARHPEGGYYREIHRSALSVMPGDGRPPRAALTTIYFLLTAGDVSCWHRVAGDEAWHFLEGDPLELLQADAKFHRIVSLLLGPYDEDTRPVHVIAGGLWQAARSTGGYTLVACTVGPGFDFADFELLRELPALAEAVGGNDPRVAGFL